MSKMTYKKCVKFISSLANQSWDWIRALGLTPKNQAPEIWGFATLKRTCVAESVDPRVRMLKVGDSFFSPAEWDSWLQLIDKSWKEIGKNSRVSDWMSWGWKKEKGKSANRNWLLYTERRSWTSHSHKPHSGGNQFPLDFFHSTCIHWTRRFRIFSARTKSSKG